MTTQPDIGPPVFQTNADEAHATDQLRAVALDLLDEFTDALAAIADVMRRGRETHAGQDWRDLPADFHLERGRRHLDLLAEGDESEPHLAHAACRLLMALEISEPRTR